MKTKDWIYYEGYVGIGGSKYWVYVDAVVSKTEIMINALNIFNDDGSEATLSNSEYEQLVDYISNIETEQNAV